MTIVERAQQALSGSKQEIIKMSVFLRPQVASERDVSSEGGVSLVLNRHKHLSLKQQRELLPIHRVKNEILYLLEKFTTLVLVGGNHGLKVCTAYLSHIIVYINLM